MDTEVVVYGYTMEYYSTMRKKEHEQRRGREREEDTESEEGSSLQAVSTV